MLFKKFRLLVEMWASEMRESARRLLMKSRGKWWERGTTQLTTRDMEKSIKRMRMMRPNLTTRRTCKFSSQSRNSMIMRGANMKVELTWLADLQNHNIICKKMMMWDLATSNPSYVNSSRTLILLRKSAVPTSMPLAMVKIKRSPSRRSIREGMTITIRMLTTWYSTQALSMERKRTEMKTFDSNFSIHIGFIIIFKLIIFIRTLYCSYRWT